MFVNKSVYILVVARFLFQKKTLLQRANTSNKFWKGYSLL